MSSENQTKPLRRTQSERSEAMRQRLIDATIECLARDGYAGTTISTIIAQADVSRGAPIHHFPTKASLIEASASYLIQRLYVLLGKAVRSLEASDDRLHDMILASWRQLFNRMEHDAMMELMLASRRDAELAGVMRQLWVAGRDVLDKASEHYFEALHDDVEISHLFILTHWLMGGMAMEHHLMDGDHVVEHFLKLWTTLLAGHIRSRPNVTSPPPRPANWKRLVGES